MNSAPSCPQCGRPLDADAPAGLCLICLAQLGAGGPVPPPSGAEATPAGWTSPPQKIRYFGDFELYEELGRGGMGVVYRARQVSLDRVVALKMVLAAHFARHEFLERFRIEAEVVAQLRHPLIVGIYEVGQHEGQPYFAMEYVEGVTLAERTRGAPWDPRRAARCLSAVARAIQYAHENGVLHRDLKPSNILLDAQDQPRITDFGVAKRIQADDELTLTGQTLGTPAFIPPEQISAKRGASTVRSDVYAIGAILYYLLTGQPPFRGETVAETLHEVLESPPLSLRSFQPSVPADLETICLRSLAKNPERRYASAADFADDLDRWLEGKPIEARPVHWPERVWLWSKRQPALATASALLGLCLLLGTAGVLWQWHAAESARRGSSRLASLLQAQQAERQFAAHRPASAMGTLLTLLRRDSTHSTAATRLLSALNNSSLALPIGPDLTDGSDLLSATFSPEGEAVATVDRQNGVRLWDPVSGQPRSPRLQQPHMSFQIGFQQKSHLLQIALAREGVSAWDTQTGRWISETKIPALTCAAWHPESDRMALGLSNGLVQIVTANHLETKREWSTEAGAVQGLAFSGDGHFLAVRTGDHLGIWSLQGTPVEVATNLFPSNLGDLSVSPDGHQVAAWGLATNVWIWDWATPCETNLNHAALLATGCFSPDGGRFATGTRDGTLTVWDLFSYQPVLTKPAHQDVIHALAFSPDGLRVATGSQDHTAQVRDAWTGELLLEPIEHGFWIASTEFDRTGRCLLTTSLDGIAHRWDIRPGAALPTILPAPGPVRSAYFALGGSKLVSIGNDGDVLTWNRETGLVEQCLRTRSVAPDFDLKKTKVDHTAIDSGLQQVAIAWSQETSHGLILVDLRSGRVLPVAEPLEAAVRGLEFSQDGHKLAATVLGRVYLISTETGRLLVAPMDCRDESHTSGHVLYSAKFSPNGRYLVTGCHVSHARMWDAESGKPVADLPHHAGVGYADFSPDGQKVVTCSWDTQAKLWLVEPPGRLIRELKHRDQLTRSAFSPDGRRLLVCSFDGSATIWEVATGRRLAEPLRHRLFIPSGRFSPDGKWICTSSLDKTIRVWDAESGLPLAEPFAHEAIPVVTASANWDWFATCDGHQEIRLWPNPGKTPTHPSQLFSESLKPLPMPFPMWLVDLVEALLEGNRVPELSEVAPDPQKFIRRKNEVLARTGTDYYTRWAKWFLADRGERAVSSESQATTQQWINRLIEQGNWAERRLAGSHVPDQGLVLARIADASWRERTDACARAEARHLLQRAARLEPDSAEIQRIIQELQTQPAPEPRP